MLRGTHEDHLCYEALKGVSKVNEKREEWIDSPVVDARRREDDGAVIEEVVRTSELLEHLQTHAQDEAVCHSRCVPHVDPLLDGSLLVTLGAQLGLDFLEFHVDAVVVRWRTVHLGHGLASFLCPALAIRVSRCLRKEEDTGAQDERPDEADANDDAPGCGLVTLMLVDAKVEAGGQEDTEGDEQLVCRD